MAGQVSGMGLTMGNETADPEMSPPAGITKVASQVGLSTAREQTWPSDAMADHHLSGSDPRMFPGIFTRGHRTGSMRNLAQASDDRDTADDVFGPET
jgi:AMP deaminase